MDYARQQRDPTRHMIGIAFVVLVHALVIWALLSGLGKGVIQIIKKPLNATIIEEVKLPPPPPPPPPPKRIVEQPKVQQPLDTYVPPPDIPIAAPTAPTISAVTAEPPKEPHVIAPPPPKVVAPPAPAKPAVRRGIVRLSGDDPSYPREAIRAGVDKGRVVARLQIDEKGNVTEVNITVSEPPRVFDKVVRAALEGWKFKAEGEKYVGEVEINFTLKDE
ncbi:MAG: TonB family protein [Betaproteobacteria bacterium]|nr:TonB family protein [Betaproteobacteria bacterium]MCC7272399.1 TonB family protein [Alphaproteobacteria bacterium]